MTMGKNIKRFRELKGLTQAELANRLGISDKTVSSWEIERTEPKIGMVEKICVALDCVKTDIVGANNQNQRIYSPDESALLKDYHLLNDAGKARARDAVSDLTQIPKYQAYGTEAPVTPLSDPFAVNAAHELDPTPEERKHADEIMMNDEEWK